MKFNYSSQLESIEYLPRSQLKSLTRRRNNNLAYRRARSEHATIPLIPRRMPNGPWPLGPMKPTLQIPMDHVLTQTASFPFANPGLVSAPCPEEIGAC